MRLFGVNQGTIRMTASARSAPGSRPALWNTSLAKSLNNPLACRLREVPHFDLLSELHQRKPWVHLLKATDSRARFRGTAKLPVRNGSKSVRPEVVWQVYRLDCGKRALVVPVAIVVVKVPEAVGSLWREERIQGDRSVEQLLTLFKVTREYEMGT